MTCKQEQKLHLAKALYLRVPIPLAFLQSLTISPEVFPADHRSQQLTSRYATPGTLQTRKYPNRVQEARQPRPDASDCAGL